MAEQKLQTDNRATAGSAAEPKYVINPSAPSTGTEGWGYGKDEAASVNFGVWPEEHKDAGKSSEIGHPNRSSAASTSAERTSQAAIHPASSEVRDARLDPAQIEAKIRARAYEIFEARGRTDGNHADDWQRAETEILAKR